MKRILTRSISLLLVIAILIQLLPMTVFATEDVERAAEAADLLASERAGTDREALRNAEIQLEETALREENVKHFRMEGGSYLAMAYDTPVHYRDAAGLWQDYDNTLQTVRRDGTVSAYRVENGQSVRTFAADAAEEQLLTAQYGAYALCLTPVAAPSAELPVQPTEPVIAAGVEEPEEIQAEPVTEAEAPARWRKAPPWKRLRNLPVWSLPDPWRNPRLRLPRRRTRTALRRF